MFLFADDGLFGGSGPFAPAPYAPSMWTMRAGRWLLSTRSLLMEWIDR